MAGAATHGTCERLICVKVKVGTPEEALQGEFVYRGIGGGTVVGLFSPSSPPSRGRSVVADLAANGSIVDAQRTVTWKHMQLRGRRLLPPAVTTAYQRPCRRH